METFESAIKLIKNDGFMASIDIKDTIPIHTSFRKYLRFVWNNQVFQFTCFPNGLARAPRKYTKWWSLSTLH